MSQRANVVLTYAGVAVLIIAVFAVDQLTPVGFHAWVGYAIPLLLVARLQRSRPIVFVASTCSAMVVIDAFLATDSASTTIAWIDRALDVGVLWVIGLLLIRREYENAAQRKASDRALQRSQQRLRELVHADFTGVVESEPDGRIIDANAAFLDLVGYSYEDLQARGIGWHELTPPEYGHLDDQATHEALASGEARPYETEFIRKDGSRVPVLVGVVSVDREAQNAICLVFDLTERKRMEAELLRAATRLRPGSRTVPKHFRWPTRRWPVGKSRCRTL